MSGEQGLIEREDLERLKRLSSAAGALLETNYNNQLVEETFARLNQYKDRFLALFRVVTECDSEHRAQDQAVNDLGSRLGATQTELSETQAKLATAVDAADVDAVARLNDRLPALQRVHEDLKRKVEEAREQLAARWQSLEGARSQVLDLRREVDQGSGDLERITAIVVHNDDPALEEIRARHREQLSGNPKDEARSLAQPEESKVIHLTRRADELPIQVTRSSKP